MNEKELKVERVCSKCGEVNELRQCNVHKKIVTQKQENL